jgi:hypothetical protein
MAQTKPVKKPEIQSEKEIQLTSNCPFCLTPITWINDVPIELNSTVHLGVCNMGRF